MKEIWPDPTTGADTIKRFGELAVRGRDPQDVAKAWSEAGFDDEATARWLEARCFEPSAARALADMGVSPAQAAYRTRDGGDGRPNTVGFKVANGDLTPRQGAARSMSSR